MTSNGETASPAEGQTDASLQSGSPTVESICRDLVSLVTSKDAEIEKLQSQLREAKAEIGEVNLKRMEMRQQVQSLKADLKNLQAKYEADGLMSGHKGAGEPGDDIATDAAAHYQSKDLADENAFLKAKLMELEVKMSAGQSTLPLDSLAPGGQAEQPSDAKEVPQPNTTTVNAQPEAVPSSTGPPASSTLQAIATSNNGKTNSHAVKDPKVIAGAVTFEMIEWLSENVSHSIFKPLVRKLGLRDLDIDDMVYKAGNDPKEQRLFNFRHWRDTHSTKATVVILLGAMRAKSYHQLAREFCSHFGLDENENKTQKQLEPAVPEDPAKTLSGLEKFMHSFPLRGNFDTFVASLHKCSKLSAKQRKALGCASQQGEEFVDVVLEEWSSKYYESGKSHGEIERSLAMWDALKICGEEVRGVFKEYVDRGGVIGPAKDEQSTISKLSYSVSKKVEELLSLDQDGVADWRDLAEWLKRQHPAVFEKVDRLKIKQWEKDSSTAPHKVLGVWLTTTQDKVGTFYKWAVENGRLDIAKALE